MKMSQLIGQTRKEVPAGAGVRSHELLLRAGYIHQVAAGIFSYLPLGLRVMQKISTILREEMEAIGAQEVCMPVAQPADLWRQSGRWNKIGAEMGRFVDRKGHDMALAMTHEEALADLARQCIHSYRDLPRLVYHLQTKWRDDPRPRAGLIRVREFVMKDSYSLDTSWEGLEEQYQKHYRAYFRIFDRCALPAMAVLADTGVMGGRIAHEFMYASGVGEDTVLFCPLCNYSANRQIAQFRKPVLTPSEPAALEQVATPNCKTIAEVSAFLGVSASECAKMVFFVASFAAVETESGADSGAKPKVTEDDCRLVAAALPGDMTLNETKLAAILGAKELRPAEDEEIRAVGAVPGYASPLNLRNLRNLRKSRNSTDLKGPIVVVDELITQGNNWIVGANKEGYHLRGLNYGRDFEADYIGDLCAAAAGHQCVRCAAPLQSTKAVEIGNIFQLGTFYSEAMGCSFTDQSGRPKPVLMGSYGIGVGRLAACIAEQHNDADGLLWPISVAPYQVHLLSLAGKKEPQVLDVAGQVYHSLLAAGLEVLFDDREESPGFKFKDADLIGIPIRLTIGKRSLENGGLEFCLRSQKAAKGEPKVFWSVAEAAKRAQAEIRRLEQDILNSVREVEYCSQ